MAVLEAVLGAVVGRPSANRSATHLGICTHAPSTEP
jgi:hypothetical protein